MFAFLWVKPFLNLLLKRTFLPFRLGSTFDLENKQNSSDLFASLANVYIPLILWPAISKWFRGLREEKVESLGHRCESDPCSGCMCHEQSLHYHRCYTNRIIYAIKTMSSYSNGRISRSVRNIGQLLWKGLKYPKRGHSRLFFFLFVCLKFQSYFNHRPALYIVYTLQAFTTQ